jgi:hypothetical protein
VLLCDPRGISRKLVEGRSPAADMAVAALDIEEGPLMEGLDRLAALLMTAKKTDKIKMSVTSPLSGGRYADESPASCSVSRPVMNANR